jgi:hypothetical protein
VSRSSAESEYRGLILATAEIIWMQALLCIVPRPFHLRGDDKPTMKKEESVT